MSEFVQTMKNWRRMCQHMSDMFGDDSCDRCPLIGCAAIYEDNGEMDYADVKNKVDAWAAEHPELVYPTWGEWLEQQGICFSRLTNYSRVNGVSIPEVFNYQFEGKTAFICGDKVNEPIPADIAQKLGLQPKGGV